MFGGQQYGYRRRGLLPPAIKSLLILNSAIYVVEFVLIYLGREVTGRPPSLYLLLFESRFGLLPLHPNLNPDLAHAYGSFMPWQLVTYMFLHGSFMHVGINMLMLWMFGTEIEERWRTRHFTTYYFICGIGGGALQMLVPTLLGQPPVPVVGASAAVAGALLAFGMMFPERKLAFFPIFIPIPARLFVVIYVVIELMRGMGGGSGVAHFAHLGGILFGYVYIKWQQKKRVFIRW